MPCSQEPQQKQTNHALRRTASRCTTRSYSRRLHASKTSCRSRCLSTMYRTGVAERCRATRRSPLQTKSSHGVDATSAVLRGNPTPHWQLPSNASRRGSLQAARADTYAKPPTRRRKFGHRHEATATPVEPTICIRRLATPPAEATHSHDDTGITTGRDGSLKTTPPRR